jgi:hypothetical protein
VTVVKLLFLCVCSRKHHVRRSYNTSDTLGRKLRITLSVVRSDRQTILVHIKFASASASLQTMPSITSDLDLMKLIDMSSLALTEKIGTSKFVMANKHQMCSSP